MGFEGRWSFSYPGPCSSSTHPEYADLELVQSGVVGIEREDLDLRYWLNGDPAGSVVDPSSIKDAAPTIPRTIGGERCWRRRPQKIGRSQKVLLTSSQRTSLKPSALISAT
jgi:hypothetical protein